MTSIDNTPFTSSRELSELKIQICHVLSLSKVFRELFQVDDLMPKIALGYYPIYHIPVNLLSGGGRVWWRDIASGPAVLYK